MNYYDHNARQISMRQSDTVELPEVIVLEGDAAEAEIARYFGAVSPLSKATPSVPESQHPGERPYTNAPARFNI